ncbi:MAG: rfbN, partial [Nitrospirae bacterium]|nr:rfbN [Nitrospirota bacterium]
IPRSDADLFASWSYWAHYKYLGYDRDYVHDGSLVTRFDDLDVKTKRVIAGLDSVCLGIKKTVFDTYRFLSNYAEDLELGIRLIKGGHALMFQSSNAVIHSHNRPPMYFLKRSYVDTVSLSEILMFARNDVPSEIILESLAYVYSTLKSCISKIITEDELWKRADFLVHALLEGMVNGINHFDPAWCSLRGDSFLDGFFENISPKNHPDISSEVLSILRGSLLSFLEFFSSYSPADMKEEVQNSLYKFFANAAGHYLGVTTSDKNRFLCESI